MTLVKLVDGILAATAAGRLKMADAFITLPKLIDGILTADAAGRLKMADAFITLPKLIDGILTADAAGRAKMGAGFIIESLLGTGCVTDDKVATGISPTKLSAIACMAIKAAAENIATANWTSVALDGADVVDTDAMHDPAVNNTRVTVPYAGKYLITGTLVFAASATGHRRARVRKNGAGSGIVSGYLPAAVTEVIGVPLYGVVELAANDYLELQGFQNSGGGLDTYGTTALTDVTTHLSVTFLGA